MFNKLMKHELIATSRMYLLLFFVLTVFTVIAGLCGMIHTTNPILRFIPGTIFVVYIIVLVGSLFACVAIPVVRFYKHLLTSEGYLTFTLPCTTNQIISAKMTVTMIWTVLTLSLCFLSAQWVLWVHYKINIVKRLVTSMVNTEPDILLITLTILAIVIVFFYQIAIFYLSIGFGQQFHSKILFSIVGYFLIYFAMQFINFIILFGISIFSDFNTIGEFIETRTGALIFLSVIDILLLVYGMISLHLTKRIFQRKLNLE